MCSGRDVRGLNNASKLALDRFVARNISPHHLTWPLRECTDEICGKGLTQRRTLMAVKVVFAGLREWRLQDRYAEYLPG